MSNKIQISNSLGDLVKAVNGIIHTLEESDEKVGNLDELTTIDSNSVVSAINALAYDARTLMGTRNYFSDKNVEQRFKELQDGIGVLSQYSYLQGTNLLSVIDDVLLLLSDSSGDEDTLAKRLEKIEAGIKDRSRERIVSAEEFGIVSSSTLDQTERVLELFNHASSSGANVVYFPPGIFRFRPLRVQMSNMIIKGSGRKTILQQSNSSTSPLLTFSGSVDRAFVSSTVSWGDTEISGTSFIGDLAPGDDIRVAGRLTLINLNTTLRGAELTVGGEEVAPSADKFHSEFNQVDSIDLEQSKVRLRSGINTTTGTRNAPDIYRYNFRSGVVIKDLTFEQTLPTHQFLELNTVRDFLIDNLNIRGSRNSTQISVRNSLNVKIQDTTIEYSEASPTSKGILINSSENCSVQGGAIRNAGMGVCIESTDSAGVEGSRSGLISRSNTVRGVEIANSLVSGVHEVATHDTTISSCQIRGTHGQGVFTTGRRVRIESNTIQTSRMEYVADSGNEENYVKVDEVGIRVFGAGAQDGIISNNSIEGSVYGIHETGPTFKPKNNSGLKIFGNTIVNCWRGVIIQRPSDLTGAAGVNNNFFNTTISGNTFRASQTAGQIPIQINFYVNGFQIIGNNFFGSEVATRCISLGGHFDYGVISGNSAIGFTEEQHIYIGLRSDGKSPNLIVDNNIGNFMVAGMLGRVSRSYDRKNTSLVPSNDNWFDLGLSTNRWRDVYLRNSPSVTSDLKEKEDIESETLGIDFINKLKPVSYKLIDNQSERRHHGLIAQDVERALKQLGVDTNDHGGLVIDEEGNYSLRYEELTSSLILGIQQLTQRISELENNTR